MRLDSELVTLKRLLELRRFQLCSSTDADNQAVLREVCRLTWDDATATSFSMLVDTGLVDDVDFWELQPHLLARAHQVLANTDARPAMDCMVAKLRAHKDNSTPITIDKCLMVSFFVDFPTLEAAWIELGDHVTAAEANRFWGKVACDCARIIWAREAAVVRRTSHGGVAHAHAFVARLGVGV